jgi:hypothetical protein
MADKKQEVTEKKKFNTEISVWVNSIAGLVKHDFSENGVEYDEYSSRCAMAAMTAIYQLVKSTDKADIAMLNTSNLREVVGQAASLKLNASAMPKECYFKLVTKKIDGNFVKVVEMGIEGDGNDAILRTFGNNVKTVHTVWIVKEGDEFKYPSHSGITVTPPEWVEKGLSQKVVRIVYPVEMNDGHVEYLISERDSVMGNLFSHVKNNLMNETFGICESRYKASEKQLDEIKAKKEAIFDAMRKCKTVDEMVACPEAMPYISPSWTDSFESMVTRKMRNNAMKRITKNFSSMAQKSFLEMDETYKASQEEIKEQENSEVFDTADIDVEAVEVTDQQKGETDEKV